MSYEPDADVFRVELHHGVIDYAQEMGPFVVHYSGNNTPLYIEILDAHNFFSKSEKMVSKARVVQTSFNSL